MKHGQASNDSVPDSAMCNWNQKLGSVIRPTAALAVVLGLSLGAVRSASADDQGWTFRRSYFSHVMPPEIQARYPVPESRSAYRRPLVTPGFGVRGSYRYNPIEIYDGRSTDVEIYRQFWFQTEQ
jgi:hypothetical protein